MSVRAQAVFLVNIEAEGDGVLSCFFFFLIFLCETSI